MSDSAQPKSDDFLEKMFEMRKADFAFYDSPACERIAQCIKSNNGIFTNGHIDQNFDEISEQLGLSGFTKETIKQFVGVMGDSSIGGVEPDTEFLKGTLLSHEATFKRNLHVLRVFKANLIIIGANPLTEQQKQGLIKIYG
jgi:hypothetical protein